MNNPRAGEALWRIARVVLILILAVCTAGAGGNDVLHRTEYHVSPRGSAHGDGSRSRPWDLATALAQPARVKPGDLIWLHGGTYTGTFRSLLCGTPARPIVVRQFPGEHATIDGGDSRGAIIFLVDGAYTWFWGFEVTSSDPRRVSLQPGSWVTDVGKGEGIFTSQEGKEGRGCRFINLYVHDARQGIGFWKGAVEGEIYGCIICDNGWCGPDRAHGHGIYAQNGEGKRRIVDNIVLDDLSHGIQIYGSGSAPLDNFVLEGNIVSGHGGERDVLVGGESTVHGLEMRNNYVVDNPGATALDVGWNAAFGKGATDVVLEGNYIVGQLQLWNVRNASVRANTVVGNISGFRSEEYSDNTYLAARPATNVVAVRPNAYEPGRANILVINWENAAFAAVDCSSVLKPGERYTVRNARQYAGPAVASGTFSGSAVTIPLKTPYPPVAGAPCHPPPGDNSPFSVFVLSRDESAGRPSPRQRPAAHPPG